MTSTNILKEQRLCLLLSRKKAALNIDNYLECSEIRTLLESNIDWKAFLDITTLNEYVALVYLALTKLNSPQVPDWVLKKLKHGYDIRRIQALTLASETLKIITLLQSNNIRFFILKGIPLALSIYEDIALRETSDIDILIHSADLKKSIDLVSARGFEAIYDNDKDILTNINSKRLLYKYHHIDLENRATGVAIELHWKLGKEQFFIPVNNIKGDFSFDSLWENRIEVPFYSKELCCFSIEDEILYLIYHAATHYFLSFKWLSDVYELMSKDFPINYTKLVSKAKSLGLLKSLAQILILCSEYFQLDLNIILLKVEDPKFSKLINSRSMKVMTSIISELFNYNYKVFSKTKRNPLYTVKIVCYLTLFKIFLARKDKLMPLLYYEIKKNIDIIIYKVRKIES